MKKWNHGEESGESRGGKKMPKEAIKDHKDLGIYKIAFEAAMRIFELSKKFPLEERYSLTDPPGSAVAAYGSLR